VRRPYLKSVVFIACLLPVLALLWRAQHGLLGANPIEEIIATSGTWTLRFLLLTLLLTPLKRKFGWQWPVRLRRMMGLYAFFYACLHLFAYLWLDQFFAWREIWLDIVDRPFITVGMLAFILLVPLAATSNQSMTRRLGRNWKRLHRLAYVIPCLGILHFWWLVKADIREPLLYAVLLIALLLSRVRATATPALRSAKDT
jgi:sulfoxide reductase heme-binding subunit YedZ